MIDPHEIYTSALADFGEQVIVAGQPVTGLLDRRELNETPLETATVNYAARFIAPQLDLEHVERNHLLTCGSELWYVAHTSTTPYGETVLYLTEEPDG